MAIIKNVNFHEFYDAFQGRVDVSSWSREGLSLLYDYLEGYSEATGEDYNFDPVALNCEFSEYDDFRAMAEDYKGEFLDAFKEALGQVLMEEPVEGASLEDIYDDLDRMDRFEVDRAMYEFVSESHRILCEDKMSPVVVSVI